MIIDLNPVTIHTFAVEDSSYRIWERTHASQSRSLDSTSTGIGQSDEQRHGVKLKRVKALSTHDRVPRTDIN